MEQVFLKESLVYGLLPVLLILLVFVGSLLSSKKRLGRSFLCWSESSEARVCLFFVGCVCGMICAVSSADAWASAQSSTLGVGILILFLLQPTLVKRTALVFSCVRFLGMPNSTAFFAVVLLSVCCTLLDCAAR